MKREHIDCVTPDPFTEKEDAKLELTETFTTYKELLDKHKLIRNQDLGVPCGIKDLPPIVQKKKKIHKGTQEKLDSKLKTEEQVYSKVA